MNRYISDITEDIEKKIASRIRFPSELYDEKSMSHYRAKEQLKEKYSVSLATKILEPMKDVLLQMSNLSPKEKGLLEAIYIGRMLKTDEITKL